MFYTAGHCAVVKAVKVAEWLLNGICSDLLLNGAIHWINIAPQTVQTFNFKCNIYIWHSIICKNISIFFLVRDISFSTLNSINLLNV